METGKKYRKAYKIRYACLADRNSDIIIRSAGKCIFFMIVLPFRATSSSLATLLENPALGSATAHKNNLISKI